MFERNREEMANEMGHHYFPFTHGDHIEREREILKSELKAQLKGGDRHFDSISMPSYYSSEKPNYSTMIQPDLESTLDP